MISSREVGNVIATYLRGQTESVKGAGPPQAAGTTAAPRGDGIDLPGTQAMAAMLSTLRSLPDARPDAVAAAKTRLASGNQPPARDVARQILSRSIGDHIGGQG